MSQPSTIADAFIDAINRKSAEDVRRLLAEGKDANATNERGITPLMWAANNNEPKIAKLLIDHGVDLNAQDEGAKYTALMYAARFGHGDIAEMLGLAGANLDLKDSNNRTAADIADFVVGKNNLPFSIGTMLREMPDRLRRAKERELKKAVTGCTTLTHKIAVKPALKLRKQQP